MAIFKSITFFLGCCLLITSCGKKTKDLPIEKITTHQWHKSKKAKKIGYDGPQNFYDYYHQIRTQAGATKPNYPTNYKQTALQKALKSSRPFGS